MTDHFDMRSAIIDTAVSMAERSSWEAVRLFDIAAELNISLDDIRKYFSEKEELIDAWFDRADAAMLRISEQDDFLSLSSRARLHLLIMTWLDTLAKNRPVTRQMIGAKLEPGHIHIQIPAIMRISRTVQWVREAAQRDATFLRRALEETALTTLYLATFTHWMFDDSANSQRTRDFLEKNLQFAEILDHTVYRHSHQKTDSASTEPRLIPEIPTENVDSQQPAPQASTQSGTFETTSKPD